LPAGLKFRHFALVLACAIAVITSASVGRVGAAAAPPQGPGSGISSEALAQIEALIRDKEARTPIQQKIDSQLLYEARMKKGVPIVNELRTIETDVPYAPNGRVIVDIKASLTPSFFSALAALGGEVVSSDAAATTARAQINIDQIEALAAVPDVVFIQPRQDAVLSRAAAVGLPPLDPSVVFTQTGQGSRSSEGDTTHLAFAARQAWNANGTGLKIGVLSDGVTSLATSQARGDLGPVTVLPGQAGSGDEGTAMLEIIHDLAPGAQLYFATAVTGIAQFANNIRALRTAGCDIIVDDVLYFVETPFQDGQAPSIVSNTNGGVVIQAVNDVTASGALYFSSAGNSGNLTGGTAGVWEGDFSDGGATGTPLPTGNRLHNFGSQNFNVTLAVSATAPINLYWSDPLGGSSNDYDLFRLDSGGTSVLASSTNIQNGTQDPYEAIASGAIGNRIVIVKKAAAQSRFLHLNTNRGLLTIATSGQTHGHNSAAAAFGTAASPAVGPFPRPFNATNTIETFSSDGPRRLFFLSNGAPYTPGNFSSSGGILRQKPDITAADGVSVTGVGGFPTPFFGTSAAAPHAAAIAGLLLSAKPSLTPAQVRTILNSSAIDIMSAGVDRNSGAGIIMADAAMRAAGIPGPAFVTLVSVNASDDPGNGNGYIEAGEGARLILPLANYGALTATQISAALTSSTPGITIQQPNVNSYPNLAVSASANGLPYRFTVASDFACPATANFTLSVTYTGGVSPQAINFTVPIGPKPFTITTNIDTTPPPPSPGVTTATGTQGLRVFRDGIMSSCGTQKVFPGTTQPGTRQFDSYLFNTCQNSVASCVTVLLEGTNAINLFTAAYVPSFNPADVGQNYKADPGSSADSRAYSFDLPGGKQTFAIDVHDVAPGAPSGIQYSLSVMGACGGACAPPNHPPVAKAKNVTVSADNTCTANASINDGSFDPDGDPLTINQSPSGPYVLGITGVLLTVKDPYGATGQASANVTVVDKTAPTVTGVTVSPASLSPPNHKMIDVLVSYTASDSCNAVACVLSVSSNQPVNGTGDGDTEPDWVIIDAHHVQLRAERAGTAQDRIYTITVTCTDAAGNQIIKQATVVVPKDNGKP